MFAVPRLGLGRAVPSSVAASSAAPVRLQRLSGALLQRGRSAEFQSFKFQQRTADLGSVRHHQHRRGINTWTRTPKHHFRQKSHLPSRLFFPTMSSDPNGSRSFTSEPETSSPSLIPEHATIAGFQQIADVPKDFQDALVIFLSPKEVKEARKGEWPEGLKSLLESHGVNLESTEALLHDFKAAADSIATVYTSGEVQHKRLVFVGIGERSELTVQTLRGAVKAAVKATKGLNTATFHLESLTWPAGEGKTKSFPAAPSTEGPIPEDFAELTALVARTAVVSTYDFSARYKGKADSAKKAEAEKEEEEPKTKLTQIAFVNPSPSAFAAEALEAAVNHAYAVACGTILTADLVNLRADVANPDYLETVAKQIAEVSNGVLNVRVVDFETLKKEGYSLITAVGQAAEYPPRILALEYKNVPEGADSSDDVVALVGKGVTFDTGGLDLKPTMKDMWMDMAGAATVLGVARTLAQTKLPGHVIAVAAIAENAISERAYRPFSIIKSAHGPTVEIGNTDAEGRLCLVDAFTWVQKHYEPKQLINLATLTGACIVALGDQQAGLFSNSGELVNNLMRSSLSTGERLWQLPISPQHEAALKGTHSDLVSCQLSRTSGGGSSSAAAFLKAFINDGVQWAHLDVAGPAMDGSGFGVQLLMDYLQRRAAEQN